MIDQCLELTIGKLINEITYNGQLQKFRATLQTRKIYNNYERNYIENQKIKDELGEQYESDQSDEECDGILGSMNKYELKCLLKQNLIKQKFDQQKLSFIQPPSISVDSQNDKDFNESKLHSLPIQNTNISYVSNLQELNPIDQRKQMIENTLNKKNWFALDFVIKQLQTIIQDKLNPKQPIQNQDNFEDIDESQESQEED